MSDFSLQDLRDKIMRGMAERYEEAALKATNEFDTDAIRAEIVEELQNTKRAVVMRVLGLEKYGTKDWRFDTKSDMAEYLREEIGNSLRETVRDMVKEILERDKDSVNTRLRKAMEYEVADHTSEWQFRRYVEPVVEEQVRKMKTEFMDKLRSTT